MQTKVLSNFTRIFSLLCLISLLSSCFDQPGTSQDGPPRRYVNVNNIPNAVPRHLPRSRYGNPASYVVNGERYHVLRSALGYNKRGIASWYGTEFNGRLTSTRQPYNMFAMTAASKVLPLPTFARVTNLENGRQVIVKVNDRGPFAPNRIIDLSWVAATKLGFAKKGTALVQVTAIDVRNPYKLPPVRIPAHPKLYLQAGAFHDWANAERLRQRLQQATHHRVIIATARSRQKPIYRVQIGPLVGVGESDKLHALLEHDGFGNAISVIR